MDPYKYIDSFKSGLFLHIIPPLEVVSRFDWQNAAINERFSSGRKPSRCHYSQWQSCLLEVIFTTRTEYINRAMCNRIAVITKLTEKAIMVSKLGRIY